MTKEKLFTLSEELLALPQEITNAQVKLVGVLESLDELSKKKLVIESKIKINIANQIDDGGKKVYSNEESRRAAFQEIIEVDLEYLELANRIQQVDKESQLIKLNIEFLNNTQKNIRSVLQFFSQVTE